ncbi:MAG: penicillin acylase family protein, partial [Acidimicrobiia bacterium]|nr:penicillin acylase family protein [Acidimicrobiia bacterium]
RAVLDGYAAGINHYAATHRGEAFAGLYPVTGKDVVAGFVQKAPLFFGIDGVLSGLFSDERPDLTAMGVPTAAYGSNALAVSPARSSDGSTMLAVNSHQPWTGPVAWYEAQVTSDEGWDMTGGLFPGMPVFALGHNRDLGWALTVNRPDLIDVFVLEINPDNPDQYLLDGVWTDLEIDVAELEVRLLGRLRWTVTRELLWSEFGPVVRQPHGTYAIRYAGMGEVGMVEQFYRMNKARNFDEWRGALELQSGLPSFSIGYADRTGMIAYLYHGLIPERSDGIDWQGYLPGTDSSLIWSGYVPLDDLPWVISPGSGFIQNANSTPFTASSEAPLPADFPAWMGVEDHESNRSLRAFGLLSSDESISFEEFIAYKFDIGYAAESVPVSVQSRIVESVEPVTPEQAAAIRVVEAWQPDAAPDNRGTALVVRTVAELIESGRDIEPSRLVGGSFTGEQLVDAFGLAVDDLFRTYGRVDPEWGEVNRLVRGDLDLPIGGGPDTLHAVYGDWSDGRFDGVAGDAYVLMVRWLADGSFESFSIHQFGSATLDPGSSHYGDQAPLFARRELKPVWFEETDVRNHLEREYRPGE